MIDVHALLVSLAIAVGFAVTVAVAVLLGAARGSEDPTESMPKPDPEELERQLRALIAEGRTVEAIKQHRNAWNCPLAESKEAIERLRAQP